MITSHPVLQSSRARTLACLGLIFTLNVYIVHNLFNTEFTQELVSVDAAFMSFARWLADHWNDSSWLPMWVMGTPARQVYNPALHHTVAGLSLITGWTVQHAYHFVTATTYCLGPVTLFWLCYRSTKRHSFALLTALLYSLISPSAFLATHFRVDNGGLFNPRRLQTLVHYGEGPHVTALMLIPLVIWLLDEAAAKRRWMFLPLATIALAAIPLTNWTGTTGLIMALAAYVFSKFQSEHPIHWPTFIGIGALAYALACYWIPPSLIRTVQQSSVGLDIITPWQEKAAVIAFAALVMYAAHRLFTRYSTPSIYRFFAYLAMISGAAVLAKMWFGRVLIPIAHRFHLEMEMGIVGAVAFLALLLATRLPRRVQYAALAAALLAGAAQARFYRRESRNTTVATDVRNTPDYRMSQWFAANANGERVFAPGTVAIWMNLYSDVPQFYGCCDQTVRADEVRMAIYDIYSGKDDGKIGAMWLKLFGVGYIGVTQPEFEPPFADPKKFDGVLQEVWRDGPNAIYKVPRPNASLAHVVPTAALNQRRPINGIDIEPLQSLITALDNPPSNATFHWLSQHEAEITAHLDPGQSIFVQETCDPGWHTDSQFVIECGPLGLMKITTGAAGDFKIHLAYTWSREDLVTRVAQLGGLSVLLLWTLLARIRNFAFFAPLA